MNLHRCHLHSFFYTNLFYCCFISFEGTFRNGKRNGRGKYQLPDGRVEIYRYVDDESSGDGVRLSANKKKTWCMHSGKVTKRISVEEAAAIAKDLDLLSVVSDVLEQLVAKIVASSNNEPGQEDSTHTLAEDKGGDDIPANADEDDTNMRVAQDEGIEPQRTPLVDIRTNNNNIAEEEAAATPFKEPW